MIAFGRIPYNHRIRNTPQGPNIAQGWVIAKSGSASVILGIDDTRQDEREGRTVTITAAVDDQIATMVLRDRAGNHQAEPEPRSLGA